MDTSDLCFCRGCAREVSGDPVSLMDPFVRQLYEKCTYQLLPDPTTDAGPNQICGECHNKCQEWFLFKRMCLDNEKSYSKESPEQLQPDSLEYIDGCLDGCMEDFVLQVEEDEDDLLTYNECFTESNQSFEDIPHAKDNRMENDQSVEPKAPDCIEWRLRMWMDIQPCDFQDDNAILPFIDSNKSTIEQSNQSSDKYESTHVNKDTIQLSPSVIYEDVSQESVPEFMEGEMSKVVDSTDNEIAADKEGHSLEVNSTTTTFEVISDDELEEDLNFFGDLETYRDCLQKRLEEGKLLSKERIYKRKAEKNSLIAIAQKVYVIKKTTQTDPYDIWKCPLCVVTESSRSKLEQHLERDHNGSSVVGLVKCPCCEPQEPPKGQRAMVSHLLTRHIGDHHCRLCFASFVTRQGLNEHRLKDHRLDWSRKFHGCPVCDIPCPYGGIKRHLQKMHLVTEETRDCPACSVHYKYTDDLIEHIFSYHSIKWKCAVCLKQCYSSEAFALHERMHKDKEREEEDSVHKKNQELLRLVRELREDVY